MNNATRNLVNNMNAKLDRINESFDSKIRTQKLRQIMQLDRPHRPAVKSDIVDILRSLQH